MNEYSITIEETVSKSFKITALSKEDAIKIAEEKYKAQEIILEPGFLIDVKFSI